MSLYNLLKPNDLSLYAENLISDKINGIQGNIISPSNTVGQVLKITSVENKTVEFQNESGGGGGGFPLAVTGDSVNAFKVETAGFDNILNVDTITPQVNITDANIVISGNESLSKLNIIGSTTNQQLTYSTLSSQPLPLPFDCDSLLTIKRLPAARDSNLAGLSIVNQEGQLFLGSNGGENIFYSNFNFGFVTDAGGISFSAGDSTPFPGPKNIQFDLTSPAGGDYIYKNKPPVVDNPELITIVDTPGKLTTKAYVDNLIASVPSPSFPYVSTLQISFPSQTGEFLATSGVNVFGSKTFDFTSGKTIIINMFGDKTMTQTQALSVNLVNQSQGKTFGSINFPQQAPDNDNWSLKLTLMIGIISIGGTATCIVIGEYKGSTVIITTTSVNVSTPEDLQVTFDAGTGNTMACKNAFIQEG